MNRQWTGIRRDGGDESMKEEDIYLERWERPYVGQHSMETLL